MSKSSQAKERLKNNQAKQNQAVNGKPKSKKYYAKAGEVWSINDAKTRGHKSLITKRKKSEPEKIEHISREDVDSIRDRVLNHSLPSKSNKEKIQKLHKKNRD